ncbi:MAG: ribonuclease D [Gammaproteobacteria bacterium]|jgi:ribonuclease D
MTEDFLFIDNEASLSELCNKLEQSNWLAVDTEFERVNTYYPELCLIQVSNGIVHAIIDPIAIHNLDAFYNLLYDESITKVLHSAHQDLEIFFNIKKSIPTPLFDTQIAAPLFDYAQGIGYGNLVKEVLNIELDKGYARTNWKKRPLTKEQLRYAVDDAIYLGKIYEIFAEKIKSVENLHNFNAQIERLYKPQTYEPDPATMWKKIFAAKRLKGKQLDIVKKLAEWREITARKQNRPRKWVLENHQITDLAKLRLESKKDLLNVINEKALNKHGDELFAIVKNI